MESDYIYNDFKIKSPIKALKLFKKKYGRAPSLDFPEEAKLIHMTSNYSKFGKGRSSSRFVPSFNR